jgi:putative ABC transport system permease protein
MENLLQDIRYALRFLRRRPVFTCVAMVALGLGIGAVTAIFSVVSAVLLRPLPFANSERLAIVSPFDRIEGEPLPASYPDYLDWREQMTAFESLAAYTSTSFRLSGGDQVEMVDGEMVSPDFFHTLGVAPVAGRFFLPEEGSPEAGQPVAVLGADLWRTRFGGDPSLLGQSVRLNDVSFVVVGIAPPGFHGFDGESQIWVPIVLVGQVNPRFAAFDLPHARSVRWHQVVGLLKEGVPLERARAEMSAIATRLERAYPESNAKRGLSVALARDELVKDLRPRLVAVLGAAAFVLLIACANLANLLLARFDARRREIAVRAATGAGTARIARQLLTESLVLGLLGGGAGLLLAYFTKDLLLALLPMKIPAFVTVTLDGQVLAFALGLSLLTGMVFGLAPVRQATRMDLVTSLKAGARGAAEGGNRPRLVQLLVVGEVALVLVLLVGSGLMLKSLRNLSALDLGFDPDRLLTVSLGVPQSEYTAEEEVAVVRSVVDEVASLPGVESATVSSYIFFSDRWINEPISIEGGAPASPDERIGVFVHIVGPRFFETLDIRLLRGRGFTAQDAPEGLKVAVVSRALAERYWPKGDALGRRIRKGAEGPWLTIVGIADDVRHTALAQSAPTDPDLYMPLAQNAPMPFNLLLRTATEPQRIAPAVKERLRKADSRIAMIQATPMDERLARETAETRFVALLIGFFAFVSLVLASTGIYGILAAAVGRRQREIGIRLTLGATKTGLLKVLVGRGLALTLAGIVLGLFGAFAASRFLASLLFEVSATDPAVLILVPVMLIAIAWIAAYIPARRAVEADLMRALKEE